MMNLANVKQFVKISFQSFPVKLNLHLIHQIFLVTLSESPC